MPAAPRSATTLFGRAAELAGLRAALNDAADGRGGVVIVEGEAGIGKTTLVERAIRDARVPVLRGGARQREALQPFRNGPRFAGCVPLGGRLPAGGDRRSCRR